MERHHVAASHGNGTSMMDRSSEGTDLNPPLQAIGLGPRLPRTGTHRPRNVSRRNSLSIPPRI
jgi:hypothetical protein